MSRPHKVLVACSDLIFSSKIQFTVKSLGSTVLPLGGGPAPWVEGDQPDLVIVDLDGREPDPIELIRSLRAHSETLRILAFVRHDRSEAIRDAREAGASQVFSRGAFSQRLPDLVERSIDDIMRG